MKLLLLDIEQYIQKNDVKLVENANIFALGGKQTFDEKGLWSEMIFGRIGSKDRKRRFGYVNLNCRVFHPLVYKLVNSVSEITHDILVEKRTFSIKDKTFVEDPGGETGLTFLIESLGKFKFVDIAKKDKLDIAQFLDDNIKSIAVDKFLVLPAGVRDLSTEKRFTKQFSSEINELYERLITFGSQLSMQFDSEIQKILVINVQKILLNIVAWLQDKMRGKGGIFRGTILKKTMDYTARVAAISDPSIEMGYIGVPWHTVLTLFEPFFFNYVYFKNLALKEEIKVAMKVSEDTEISYQQLKQFNYRISKSPEKVSSKLKELLVQCAQDISKDRFVIVKRDPVVSRSSYFSAKITVLENGRAAVVNSLTCMPLNLDFDGDTIALYSILTEEATEQAKKMSPLYSKSAWINPVTIKSHHYLPTLDSVSTIYSVTKE